MWSYWCPQVNVYGRVDCCGHPQGLVKFRALHVRESFTHKLTVDSSTDPPLLDLLRLSKWIKYVFLQPPEEAFICHSSVLTIFCYVNKKPDILFTHRDLCFIIFFIMCSKLHSKLLTLALQLMWNVVCVHMCSTCFTFKIMYSNYWRLEYILKWIVIIKKTLSLLSPCVWRGVLIKTTRLQTT